MLLLRVLEDALGAKGFRVVFAEKLDLFAGMSCAIGNCAFDCRVAVIVGGGLLCILSQKREAGKYLIVDWKIFSSDLMGRFVVRAGNSLVF